LYQGGIRVPFIARWPGHISPGSTCSTPVIGYDLLPTFAETAGKPLDSADTDYDGESLLPVFHDSSRQIDRSLYWHFPYYHPERKFEEALPSIGINDFAISQTLPQSAIRHGDQKLTYYYEDYRSELFNLNADIGEQKDLSKSQPEVASKLKSELTEYLDRVNARRPERVHNVLTDSSIEASQTADPRPNILFVYTDDQAPWGLGASGYKQAHTPNLDQLAKEGAYLRLFVRVS
jgi:arylsulfatase A